MTHPAKAQEPPMDEILASIRRMIAPDNVKNDAPTTSEFARPPAAPPAANPTSPLSAPPASPAHPVRSSAPSAQVFSTSANQDTDLRFGKRASVGQPLASPPQPSPSSPTAADMSAQAKEMGMVTAARPAIPKTDARVDGVAEEAGAGADRAANRSSPATTAALVRSEAERVRLRNNPAEPPAAREPSQLSERTESLSPETTAAVGAALDALALTVTAQSRTLEDVVRDTLRPMLKAWLDDNLPQLVERLVRAEIERISRGR
jgi:hypothetical protein